MPKNRLILIAVALIVVLLLIVWFVRRGAGPSAAIDLVEEFDTAEKRSNLALHEAFSVNEVEVGGDTKRAIAAHPTSRIIWKVPVPYDAWLRTWIALRPEVWDLSADGVLFRIGVSDGRVYDELFVQHVDPKSVPGDRRWIPVEVDLASYAGQDVEVIFNTNASLPNRGNDSTHDQAVWGSPEIYVNR